MVSWGRWWGWCRGQGKGAAKTAKIILVMVIIKLVVTLDHVIVMLLGQPEGSMVIVCAQRGKVGSMLWWARAIEVHLDYCGIDILWYIQRNYEKGNKMVVDRGDIL